MAEFTRFWQNLIKKKKKKATKQVKKKKKKNSQMDLWVSHTHKAGFFPLPNQEFRAISHQIWDFVPTKHLLTPNFTTLSNRI